MHDYIFNNVGVANMILLHKYYVKVRFLVKHKVGGSRGSNARESLMFLDQRKREHINRRFNLPRIYLLMVYFDD